MSKESALALMTGQPVEATPMVETPTETVDVTPAAEAPSELDSARFARIAKQEAKLQSERAAYKADVEAHNIEKEKLRKVQALVAEFESTKIKDPIKAIKSLGFTDQQIIQWFESNELSPEEKAVKAAEDKIQEYENKRKQEQETIEKAKVEAEENSKKETLSKTKASVSKEIADNKDTYEYCSYHGSVAQELILETIEEAYNLDRQTNPEAQRMSAKEAIELVEDYYEKEDKIMSEAIKKRSLSALDNPPATQIPVGDKPTMGRAAPTQLSRSQANAVAPAKGLAKTVSTTAATIPTIPVKETVDQKKARIIAKYFPKVN